MKIFWVLLALLTSSCSQHYFDRPQPIDSKNIYAFPEAFQGIWSEGKDSLIVSKFFFANVEYKRIGLPYTNKDTTAYAIFKNKKVYPYDSLRDQIMGKGLPYKIEGDSIFYEVRETLEVQLGRKAFLREVGSQFVLNVKGENEWWELFLMGITDQQKIVVTYPNIYQLVAAEIYPVLSNTEEDYFEVIWTKDRFKSIIGQNIFSDTLLYVDRQN